MRPPIIINDSGDPSIPGDVVIYDTVETAELSLECFDADDDWISAFDTEGTRLRIYAEGNGARLAVDSEQGAGGAILGTMLRSAIERHSGVVASEASLDALVALARASLPTK